VWGKKCPYSLGRSLSCEVKPRYNKTRMRTLTKAICLIAVLLGSQNLRASDLLESDCGKIIEEIRRMISSSYSGTLRRYDYVFLTHDTKTDNLVSILKDKVLKANPSGSKGGHGGFYKDRTFFDLTKSVLPAEAEQLGVYSYHGTTASNKFQRRGDLASAELVFEMETLDEREFHISAQGWSRYGRYEPRTDFSSTEPDGLPLDMFLGRGGKGEVVVRGDVSISHLKEIRVHPLRRDEVLAMLKNNGITEVNGKPIEKVVVSPVTKYKFEKINDPNYKVPVWRIMQSQ